MIAVKIIDADHKDDINIKNQPFPLFGLLLPSYQNGKWDHTELLFPKENVTEMCFPDENYDFEEMSKDSIFVGAYEGEKCVGVAVLQQALFQYMYLCDLKVDTRYRGKGIGATLMKKAKEIAVQQRYRGLYAHGQDNNLGACRFYLKMGFEIGGLDTCVYGGTSQEHKKDILFYCGSN